MGTDGGVAPALRQVAEAPLPASPARGGHSQILGFGVPVRRLLGIRLYAVDWERSQNFRVEAPGHGETAARFPGLCHAGEEEPRRGDVAGLKQALALGA